MVLLMYSGVFRTGSAAPGKDGPVLLTSASELSSFGYWMRKPAAELMQATARAFAKANTVGRTSVRCALGDAGGNNFAHIYVSPGGLTAVCFADASYSSRVAFGYLAKLCEELAMAEDGRALRSALQAESDLIGSAAGSWNALHQRLLINFQDPAAADQLTKIMVDLEDTKVVLHQAIESALERGVKIDTLLDKSADLSAGSRRFAQAARKQNTWCCSYM